jgi:hypothetical protein
MASTFLNGVNLIQHLPSKNRIPGAPLILPDESILEEYVKRFVHAEQ